MVLSEIDHHFVFEQKPKKFYYEYEFARFCDEI